MPKFVNYETLKTFKFSCPPNTPYPTVLTTDNQSCKDAELLLSTYIYLTSFNMMNYVHTFAMQMYVVMHNK